MYSKKQAVHFWDDLGYRGGDGAAKKYGRRQREISQSKTVPSSRSEVKEKYCLCLKDSRTRALLLQYPNRTPTERYSIDTGQKPSELRIKPKSGVVEVDIPLGMQRNFNRTKSVHLGSALKKSPLIQRGGSYGIAGGLGIGPSRHSRNEELIETDVIDEDFLLENFDQSREDGYVMKTITLSGRIIPFKDGDPMYMVASFDGTNATWTKVDAMVQLRPQFSHLDALSELDKASTRSERVFDSRTKDDKAEDVNMIIRDTADNDHIEMYGGMNETAKLLRYIRDEPWQTLDWIDQSDDRVFAAYEDEFNEPDISKLSPLMTAMSNEKYLDAISCPRIDPITQGKRVVRSLDDEQSSDVDGSSDNSDEASDHTFDPQQDVDTEQSDDGKIYETLPVNIAEPEGAMERDIEQMCRLISMEPVDRRQGLIKLMMKKKDMVQRYSFLRNEHEMHPYFSWRLECNCQGLGIRPRYDHR